MSKNNNVKLNVYNPKIKSNIKCVILGDSGIGKTSIIKQFHHKNFDKFNETTLGAIFWEINFNYKSNCKVKINFWDTAGQERYNSLIPMYVRDCDIVILAFDLTNKYTLENLKKWYQFVLNNYCNPTVIVVGNKEDLKVFHTIDQKTIDKFIESEFKNKPKFIRTSAKKNINISELFEYIFSVSSSIIEDRIKYEKNTISNNIQIDSDPNDNLKNYKCCNIL